MLFESRPITTHGSNEPLQKAFTSLRNAKTRIDSFTHAIYNTKIESTVSESKARPCRHWIAIDKVGSRLSDIELQV